ncbi:MAG: lipid-A-disaccharide synthase N-terminal domain-containing protein [Candidatus Omnitrophica bacterium]|nr:lipid-A-disaccharide synthase N-terminal domain-containing protein [Candidatus Omnitrophota bacterium]MBU4487888.1 lipid-A-disaccharide synthase N-terminal domain-containing protein [Candidatus Omnitrophota bacterium]MCG2704520.1 lipid-A-disaccharide synthase N-terminal domain-containing protein [Candidatus Omnitrophota bacterium]
MNLKDLLNPWVIFGLLGQVCFSLRFIIQWIQSERHRKSIIPVSFWYFSLFGGLILFIYAIYRQDIVFTLGQGAGLIVYARNLVLIARHKEVKI